MKCTELKIWIDSATLTELRNPEKEIKDHLKNCNDCYNEYSLMLETYHVIDSQKEQTLSSQQIESIAKNLLNPKPGIRQYYMFTKIATVAIIVAGLITGIVTGSLLTDFKTENNENTWSSEFSMLSDNSEYESYLFD
jgi:predicted anti-sigma-YlaC factor YlaD